jgi:hypothetical protein
LSTYNDKREAEKFKMKNLRELAEKKVKERGQNKGGMVFMGDHSDVKTGKDFL